MSATPTDPPTRRRLWTVPPCESSDAGFSDDDDGYWSSCTSSVLSTASGEIALLEVDGDLDLTLLPAVAAALERTLSSPVEDVVVSLSGLLFCGVRGASLLVDSGTAAAQRGIGYSISGAPAQLRRLWSMLFPTVLLPSQFSTTERALVDALVRRSVRDRTRATGPVASVPTNAP